LLGRGDLLRVGTADLGDSLLCLLYGIDTLHTACANGCRVLSGTSDPTLSGLLCIKGGQGPEYVAALLSTP
jgi:hypothetical protein